MMTFPAVQGIVKSALAAVIAEEYDLFMLGAGERAVVHQLAVYLRGLIGSEYDVDAEYDRQGINREQKLLPPPTKGIPDVVVHQRGQGGPEANLLVVEAKRQWHGAHGTDDDVRKIRAALRRFGYQFGVVLELGTTLERLSPRWSWWTWDVASVISGAAARGPVSVHPTLTGQATAVFSPSELAELEGTGRKHWASKGRPQVADWQ
jgi:hypothetical protein